MARIKKTQLIEVVNLGVAGAGNQQTRVQFPDQPYLRNKPVWGLEIFNVGDVTTSPTSNAVISLAQQKISFLTLYSQDPDNPNDMGEWIQLVPLTRLHNTQNADTDAFSRMTFELIGQRVQWEKCYFTLATPFANTANVSFLIQVYFSEPAAANQQ